MRTAMVKYIARVPAGLRLKKNVGSGTSIAAVVQLQDEARVAEPSEEAPALDGDQARGGHFAADFKCQVTSGASSFNLPGSLMPIRYR